MARGAAGFYTKDDKVRPITGPGGRSLSRTTRKSTQLSLDRFKDAAVTVKDRGMVIDHSKRLGTVVGTNVETGEKVSLSLSVKKLITVHPPSWDDAIRHTSLWNMGEERKIDNALQRIEALNARLRGLAYERHALSDKGLPTMQADLAMSRTEKELVAERSKIFGSDMRGYNRWVVRDADLANRLADEVAAAHGGAEMVPLPDLAKRDGSIWGYLVWTKGYYGYMGG